MNAKMQPTGMVRKQGVANSQIQLAFTSKCHWHTSVTTAGRQMNLPSRGREGIKTRKKKCSLLLL